MALKIERKTKFCPEILAEPSSFDWLGQPSLFFVFQSGIKIALKTHLARNIQKIAFWYKFYIQRESKKMKKVFICCKHCLT
jgi:hypothetical protein